MNTMSLKRIKEYSHSLRFLAALAVLYCCCPRRLTKAYASGEVSREERNGVFQLAEFFSSILGANSKNADAGTADSDQSAGTRKLSAQQILSSILERFQNTQSQATHHSSNEKTSAPRLNSNTRKNLYHRSVHAHYTRLVKEKFDVRNTSSPLVDAALLDDTIAYYNGGMNVEFDAREIANSEESIFARFSHWTYQLHPKQSLSQIHLKPSVITNDGDTTCCGFDTTTKVFKLPPTSILYDSVHFAMTSVVDLGAFLPPGTPDYESFISATWGPDETKETNSRGLVEYYVDGDTCFGNESRKRQSKVVYDLKCCERRHGTIMDEFFQNDGNILIQSAEEPESCRYELTACKLCPVDEKVGNGGTSEFESSPSVDSTALSHLLQTFLQRKSGDALPPMPPSQIEANKMLLRSMFTHAYDSYFYNAFPASELKPLTCTPGEFNLVRIPALTLIDTLDTLIIMGNYTEFARSVERLRYLDMMMKRSYQSSQRESNDEENERGAEKGGLFSVNQNVSLFETTIRVLGGLLSGHQMAIAFVANLVAKSDVLDFDDLLDDDSDSHSCMWDSVLCPVAEFGARKEKNERIMSDSSSDLVPTWEYDGFLLELAHDVGKRLLLAFDTETGIPYGTVNLLHGVPEGETTVASLAGAGTLSLEFELLSRLTGDLSFGKAAKLATRALWIRGSPGLNLFGKHVDSHSGLWIERLSGVGSNSDSFYEYLIKHYLLFPEDSDWWNMFVVAYSGVHDNSRLKEWYVDVDYGVGLMGHINQVFESLMAFYPGMQVLIGELVPAAKSLNSFFSVRETLGLLPERFDFVNWRTVGNGDVHPLRPELLESNYFLHLASIGHGPKRGPSYQNSSKHTSSWLWAADFALNAINDLSRVPCGFATVAKLGPTTTGDFNFVKENHSYQAEQKHYKSEHLNEMPSYFLSETIKYLYLTFDAENNVLHNDNQRDWIFTTEAHPIHYAPVSQSTARDDDRLNMQLRRVRTLLKDRIFDSSPSDEGEPDKFEQEQWTPLTPESIFVASVQHVENMIITSKQPGESHNFDSGPPFRRHMAEISPHGIFASEINQAHYQYDDRGKGNGKMLSKRCPNFYHPDLQWIHALHGDALEYNAAHSVSRESSASRDDTDERMLTALASACFHGTDFYAEGIVEDKNMRCHIGDAPEYTASEQKIRNEKRLQTSADQIPGAIRYNMGEELGYFDVSAFPNGDGFVVRHVDSQELVQVSIFQNDTTLHPSEDESTVVMVILTPPQPAKGGYAKVVNVHSSLPPRAVFSWKSLSGNRGGLFLRNNLPEDNAESKPARDEFRRHVVVADMRNNSFRCEVAITKKTNSEVETDGEADIVLRKYPCSPAFFGKTRISHLRTNGEEMASGLLVPPPRGDEYGCNQIDLTLSDQDICQIHDESLDGERDVVQIIRRGECTFTSKALNNPHAEGILVINTFGTDELFAMAGDVQPIGGERDDLPTSVLVSGNDGESILELIADEQSKGNVLNAHILMTKDGDGVRFPQVNSSSEGLSVLASNGWGVRMLPLDSQTGWQLFLMKQER